MSFGDDILEYCQDKLHLTTSVEMELRTTSSFIRESQGSLRQQQDTSRRSSASSSPEPEYDYIDEHHIVTLQRYPNGEGESVERASMVSDSYKMEDDLRNSEPEEPASEAGGQPWFATSRTPSPQDRYSPVSGDYMLDQPYQQGPDSPTSTPLHEDPLWYSGNQSVVSKNNGFTEAVVMPEGLHAEIHDSDSSLTLIPSPHRPRLIPPSAVYESVNEALTSSQGSPMGNGIEMIECPAYGANYTDNSAEINMTTCVAYHTTASMATTVRLESMDSSQADRPTQQTTNDDEPLYI